MTDTSFDLMDMRARARRLFDVGVAAAAPDLAVRDALQRRPVEHGSPHLIAVGKAAVGMMRAARESIPSPASALVVTNPENAQSIEGVDVMAASHPVPDAAGLAAGQAVLQKLNRLGRGDHVLALISGGGSALLPAPVAGIGLEDKAVVSEALLACGADIATMNLVRQHLSDLKGGGFLRAAAPATVRGLILSDVVGDDLRVIASGPTASPLGTQSDARKALQKHKVWASLPACARAHLTGSARAQPDLLQDNMLVGSNAISRAAMARDCPEARVMVADLDGDVVTAARTFAGWANGPGVWVCGGETTVTLRGDGVGGRNQELALYLALEAEKRGWRAPWVYLQGGTDGRDGPCDAAGGLVDHTTLARMVAAGVDIDAHLAANNSYAALGAVNDLLMTGATGTNVADLGVLIRT